MSGINPSPGPVIPDGNLNIQVESPLLVVKQREIWAEIDQQRFHDETLQWFGEECIVRQVWRAEDVAIGLVTYCQDCQDSPNPSTPTASGNSAIRARVSKTYKQSGNSYCTTCFGTAFTGGFKPTCYHLYMLASDTAQVRSNLTTGQFWKDNPNVQFSWYPEIRTGDMVIRVNTWNNGAPTALGDRFIVSTVNVQTIRTGPGISYDTTKIVNQMCTIENLPPGHPYYNAPVV